MKDTVAACLRLLCGAQVHWIGCSPNETEYPCIYYANHSSHLDAAILWAAMPSFIRSKLRPVAGRDYWEKTFIRRWMAKEVFHSVLIERTKVSKKLHPLKPMLDALDSGHSLIIFPEGTRSSGYLPQAFKSGLYHLARERPNVPLIPVFLENLNRILPKGEYLPVPMMTGVFVGSPLSLQSDESKEAFLDRSRDMLCSLYTL